MTTERDTEDGPPVADPGSGDAATLEAALAEARAKAEENWSSFLRAAAESENVRRRAQRDVEAATRYAIERFAGDLLEVRDSLELGLAAGSTGDPGRILEGMQATLRLVDKAFERSGLAVVDPVGQPFDPRFHEAMAMQPSADQPPGSVLAVVQKGYVLNGRLLRPARVLVASAVGPAATPAAPD
jgi:molecular chaperone GrpE